MPNFMIMKSGCHEAFGEAESSLPTAGATRKSKFFSTHFTSDHLQVLQAKFHDRATSNHNVIKKYFPI